MSVDINELREKIKANILAFTGKGGVLLRGQWGITYFDEVIEHERLNFIEGVAAANLPQGIDLEGPCSCALGVGIPEELEVEGAEDEFEMDGDEGVASLAIACWYGLEMDEISAFITGFDGPLTAEEARMERPFYRLGVELRDWAHEVVGYLDVTGDSPRWVAPGSS